MITRYDKYLWYVLRHKWYVMVECFKEDLYWRGFIHDLSKFYPTEFVPYARHFHGPKKDLKAEQGKAGYCKPTTTGDSFFDLAWRMHISRNQHHWQFWCLPDSSGTSVSVFEMPEDLVREMVCDWRGAGKAQNNPTSIQEWYKVNGPRMALHSKTRALIEQILGTPTEG